MTDRIDISINEKGVEKVSRALDDLSNTCQALSPKLAASLRGAALRVRVNTDKLTKDVATTILSKVISSTPHDTGQARGGWEVVITNTPPNTPALIGNLDYEGDATIAKGTATIQSTKRQLGETIYITNALPYINALDKGWSSQAPAGMVAQAMQAGRAVASNKRILVK